MQTAQHWYITGAFDARAAKLCDRHYSRAVLWPQSVGKKQITIANALVLVTYDYSAVWITRWQNPIARNDGLDMWVNQIFRNEGEIPSSELITEAVRISRWRWFPVVPKDGFTTYIASELVQSDVAGYCYRRAYPRWHSRGKTKARKLDTLNIGAARLLDVEPLTPLRFSEQLSFAV